MRFGFVTAVGCVATMIFAGPGFAQQQADPMQHDHAAPMNPQMPMSPGMTMGPGKKVPQGTTMKPAGRRPAGGQSAPAVEQPITEPTIPPAEGGEGATPMHMHPIAHVLPHLPVIGRSKSPEKGPVYRLEDLEQRALARNPTLAQAQRSLEAAQGVRRQVGLSPNPTIGYDGDEIRGGFYRSGKEGFFIDQPFITGGKLGLNRKIEDQAIHQTEAASEAQRYRVLNATREAYYQVLAGQELLNIKRDLAGIAHVTAAYTRELGNTGQADETEILQTEVAEQQMLIAVGVEENSLRRAWEGLRSTVGDAELPMGSVVGDLESLPEDQTDAALESKLLAESPAVRYAEAGVARAEAELKRARRDSVPDITARGGVAQDNEPLDTPQSRVGLVGYAEIGLQLHLFDRNQGNVAADRAAVERAQEELTRVELALRDRSAAVREVYHNERLIATRYRDEILPRTQRAYVLMTQQYGLMDASFARVLTLQHELYTAEVTYLQALEGAQTSYVALVGFLYSGGLEGPEEADPVMRGSAMPREAVMPRDLNAPNAQVNLFESGLQP